MPGRSSSSRSRTSRGSPRRMRRMTTQTSSGSSAGWRPLDFRIGIRGDAFASRCLRFETCGPSCAPSPCARMATGRRRERRWPRSIASCATGCITTCCERPMAAPASTWARSATISTRRVRRLPDRWPTTWPSMTSIGSECARATRAAPSSSTAPREVDGIGATWARAATGQRLRGIARGAAASVRVRFPAPPQRTRMPTRRMAATEPAARHVRLPWTSVPDIPTAHVRVGGRGSG